VICFDASVAANLVPPEAHSDSVAALYAAAEESNETIVVPHLLPIEVANIVRKRLVRNAMSLQAADEALERFLRLRFTLFSPSGLHRGALKLSDSFGVLAVCEAHYVVLAQTLGCDL
jgi:predicted nucleic acid-binding protein